MGLNYIKLKNINIALLSAESKLCLTGWAKDLANPVTIRPSWETARYSL